MSEQAAIGEQEYTKVVDEKKEPLSIDQAIAASVTPIVVELKRINELEFDDDIMPLVSKNVASKMVKDELRLMRSEKLSITPNDISAGLSQYMENEKSKGVDTATLDADMQMAAAALLENTPAAGEYRDNDKLNQFVESIKAGTISEIPQEEVPQVAPEPSVIQEQPNTAEIQKKRGLNALFWKLIRQKEEPQKEN